MFFSICFISFCTTIVFRARYVIYLYNIYIYIYIYMNSRSTAKRPLLVLLHPEGLWTSQTDILHISWRLLC